MRKAVRLILLSSTAAVGGPAPLLPAPAAPTLTRISLSSDNRPDFTVDNVLTGDSINIRAYTDAGMTTLEDTGVVIAGSDGTVTITNQLGPLTDGPKWYQLDFDRAGYATSLGSNIETDTIDATAPTISTSATANCAENATLSVALAANETVTWAIRTAVQNGASLDHDEFEISGTTLRWSSNGTRDFEAPADTNTDNAYVVVVRATDTAGNTTDQTITVTVTDVAEGGGTVLFDAAAISQQSGAGITSVSFRAPGFGGSTLFDLNVGSGANGTTNRALVIALMFCGAAAGTSTSPAVTWDGVAMTLIGGPYANGTTGDIYFFGLVAPATGDKALAVSWNGANQLVAAGLSVVAADQAGGATTFKNATSNTGTSATSNVTVNSAAGEMVFAAHMAGANYTTQGNTDIGRNNAANFSALAANREAADAASEMLTYSSASTVFVSAGLSIKAA